MANKAGITTSINTIDDAGNNTASEVRSVFDTLNDNFYGTSTVDTNASTNVVTEVASGKVYSLRFVKQGGVVTVSGTIRNATGAITGSQEIWCNITNTEYQQLVSSNVYETGHSAGTGEPIRYTLTTNSIATFDPIGVNETININFTYDTNE